MPQSLRARATPFEPQANRWRSDWSSPDRRRRHLLLALIRDRSSLPQWPQPLGLPTRLLQCSLPQGISFYKLTSLSFSLSLSLSRSLSLSLNEMKIMK